MSSRESMSWTSPKQVGEATSPFRRIYPVPSEVLSGIWLCMDNGSFSTRQSSTSTATLDNWSPCIGPFTLRRSLNRCNSTIGSHGQVLEHWSDPALRWQGSLQQEWITALLYILFTDHASVLSGFLPARRASKPQRPVQQTRLSRQRHVCTFN